MQCASGSASKRDLMSAKRRTPIVLLSVLPSSLDGGSPCLVAKVLSARTQIGDRQLKLPVVGAPVLQFLRHRRLRITQGVLIVDGPAAEAAAQVGQFTIVLMLELLDVLALLAPTQLNEDAPAQRSRRQLPTDHTNRFRGKCRKQFRHLVVADTAQHALPTRVAAVDHTTQRGLVVVGKDVVELVETERRLPSA